MTINQTIDGVPRELLERALRELLDWEAADEFASVKRTHDELRALLDAPACKACNGLGHVPDGEIAGSGGVEFENGPVERVKDCPACKPAAHPQCEPVFWADEYNNTIKADHKARNESLGGAPAMVAERYTVPLYAEQPAPVAVVLPSFEDMRRLVTKAAREADLIPGSNYYTAADIAVEAVIDEVKHLNTGAVHGALMTGRRPIPDGIESLAQQIYQSWESQPGFVPWVEGGNSHKQDEARQIASRTFELALANQVESVAS